MGRGGGKRSETHLPSLDFWGHVKGESLLLISSYAQILKQQGWWCSPSHTESLFILFLNTQEHDSFHDPTQSLAIFYVMSPHDKATDMQVILKNTFKNKITVH